jgi:SAM-dependent methyltransferase
MTTKETTPASSQLAKDHWNKTPLYISEEERYSMYPWLYDAAEFRNHAGERVLEIGCGTGSDLLQFAKHGAVAVGIDITPEHLRLARERVGQLAKVREAEATALPFPNESFDYVYSHGVLHHIEDPRRVVDEIFRVLKPGGRFNVHVYARWSYFTLSRILKHGRNWRLWFENSRDPVHIDFYTKRNLRRLFSPARLQIEKYEFRRAPFLASLFGFFLVVKGKRPDATDHTPR